MASKPRKKPTSQPRVGNVGPGRAVTPGTLNDEHLPDGAPRDAPAPGVPMPKENYDALKERARTSRLPPSGYAQEDPSAKKRK
jgi:hypothetical protein